jgi:hypothetical protein
MESSPKRRKIIVVGAAWYGDWAKNFYNSIVRLGFDTQIVYNNSLPASVGGSKDRVTSIFEKSKAVVRRINPELFSFLKKYRQVLAEREILLRLTNFDPEKEEMLVIFTWTPGSSSILKKLKARRGVKMVLWLGEPTIRDKSWEPKFDYFDEVFIVDDGLWMDILSVKNKKRARMIPLASDEAIFYPLWEVSEKYRAEIVFVGKYIATRPVSLAGLKHRDLKIYGYGWEEGFETFPWLKEKYQGGIATEELNNVYNGAKIALGTLGVPTDPFTTATQRTFDIALLGTFQLAEEVYLSKKLFGETICFFHNDNELKERAEYYLDNEEERKALADKAREIALKYSYTEAAKTILRACKYLP